MLAEPRATCLSGSSLTHLAHSLGFHYSCPMLQSICGPCHVINRVGIAVRGTRFWQQSHCTYFLLQGFCLVVDLAASLWISRSSSRRLVDLTKKVNRTSHSYTWKDTVQEISWELHHISLPLQHVAPPKGSKAFRLEHKSYVKLLTQYRNAVQIVRRVGRRQMDHWAMANGSAAVTNSTTAVTSSTAAVTSSAAACDQASIFSK